MATGGNETEVKICVADAREARHRIESAGFRELQPREFEANTLYDTPDQALLKGGTMLRLRDAGGRGILTWKGVRIEGAHKSRPERETTVGSTGVLAEIFGYLGYAPLFRYEKYRTEYRNTDPRGSIVLDETPIGTFLELEGEPAWIDETAGTLGFSSGQYIVDSYGTLYRKWCSQKGIAPTNMVFAECEKPATSN